MPEPGNTAFCQPDLSAPLHFATRLGSSSSGRLYDRPGMGAVVAGSTAGTPNARRYDVTIAIPIWQERISPVLDTAARLLVVKRRRGKEANRKEVILSPLATDELARSVEELRVDILLCAALSDPLRRALERRGIHVRPHLCGEVEEILRAFCSRQLQRPEFRMPGCWGNHEHGACYRRAAARAEKSGGKKERAINQSTR